MGSRSHALYQCLMADLHRYIGEDVDVSELSYLSEEAQFWPGMTIKQAACVSLRNSLLKKFQDDLDVNACNAKALSLFLEMNSRNRLWTSVNEQDLTEIEAIALGSIRDEIHSFCTDSSGFSLLNAPRILANLDVGPGASVGASGSSHFHKFFGGPQTCTSKPLSDLIRSELSLNPSLVEAERIRSSFFGPVQVIRGNALSFAFKNRKISRIICTEPSENMKFQKGIQFIMECQLRRRFGIDLSCQSEKNAMLAKIGSETGRFGTTDSRSASDTISLEVMRRELPSAFFGWLNACRSPEVRLPDGSWERLHMISSMGNAFTFPLQTMLFSCIVIGCYRALDIKIVYPRGGPLREGGSLGNFGVFGDDVVVRSDAYDLVNKMLERFGFIVNHDKSFNTGDFRESCGSDYKSGHDIRGVYCRSLKTAQDVYSTYNLLSAWSANQGVCLSRTLSALRSWAPNLCVPPYENPDSGFWTPFHLASGISFDGNGSVLYNCSVPKQRRLEVNKRGHDRVVIPKVFRRGKVLKGKPYCVNNLGFIISASAGYMRGGAILLRNPPQTKPSYQTLARISPGWDWYDKSAGLFTQQGFERWLMALAQ